MQFEIIPLNPDDPKNPAVAWKFGHEVVNSPGEVMDKIVDMAGSSGLPACRLIDPQSVAKTRKAMVAHQHGMLQKALEGRITAMESDPSCTTEKITAARLETERLLKAFRQ